MILIPIDLQVPLFLIAAGILLCLLFEAAGVPEGFRRYGNKNYLSLIAVAVVLSVFFYVLTTPLSSSLPRGNMIFDQLSKSAILSLSVLVFMVLWIVIEQLKPSNSDRGEIYALILISFFLGVILCCTDDLLIISTIAISWSLAQIGVLALRQKKYSTSEIILKLIVFSSFGLLIFSMLFVFSNAASMLSPTISTDHDAAIAIAFSIVLLFLGSVPMQSLTVDLLDGAPPYAAAFANGCTFIACTVVLIRLVDKYPISQELSEKGFWLLMVFAGVSFCIASILALDQTRISRLLAYLLCSQSGLVLIAVSLKLHSVQIPEYFPGFLFTHFSLCVVGSYAGLHHWKNASHDFNTWENFAGAGRNHPLATGAFIWVLASIVGLPFTSGFALKTTVVALAPSQFRLPYLLVFFLSIVLSAVPVFRLLAFFFGKTVRQPIEKTLTQRAPILLFMCAISLLFLAMAPQAVLQSIFVK